MGRGFPTLTPVRWVLLERGITAVEVARQLGLNYCTLANLLNGRTHGERRSSAEAAQALAEYLGVEVEELFPEDGRR